MRTVLILLSFAAIGFAADAKPKGDKEPSEWVAPHAECMGLKELLAKNAKEIKDIQIRQESELMAFVKSVDLSPVDEIKITKDSTVEMANKASGIIQFNNWLKRIKGDLDASKNSGSLIDVLMFNQNPHLDSIETGDVFYSRFIDDYKKYKGKPFPNFTNAQSSNDPKPKDKKKITATLSDGTKVE